jgi:PAS domain S-box-containing protein
MGMAVRTKQAKEIMPSVSELYSVLDSVSYAIVAMDLDGKVVFLNERARAFLEAQGRRFSDCIGRDAAEFLPIATPLAKKALATEAFGNGTGRIVDRGVKLFFEITPHMLEGKLIGAIVSLQRPERFEELATKLDSHQKLLQTFQAVFHASNDGIWVCDGTGTILSINKASERLNGIRAEDFLGKNMSEVVTGGFVDQSVTLMVLKSRTQASIIQNATSTGKQLLVTGTPTFDGKGNVSLVVVNERDLTELNVLRRDLDQAQREQAKVKDELAGVTMLELNSQGLAMESPGMRRVVAKAMKLAHFNASKILILGESGTGKSMMAKFIHQNSARRDRPFISVNCAALPESLFEAELFGYERGAFTGALKEGKAGLLEVAQDGTFFLDEVGETPLHLQAKLLKCLDENEFTPVGGTRPKKIRCAIIAATNRNLEEQVKAKAFREDLYYRLNALALEIPPLRSRPEDVLELTEKFLTMYNDQYQTEKRISPKGMELLLGYSYPGNARELRNLIKQAVVMSDEGIIDEALGIAMSGEAQNDDLNLTLAIEKVERELLVRARKIYGSTREIARHLGISQPSVVRKMGKHKIR